MSATPFLIGAIVVVAIIAIVFLILWLTRGSGTNAPSGITNVRYTLTNPTTVVATWDTTRNTNETVTLLADTTQINLDASGRPTGNPRVLVAGPVPSSTRTLTLSTLAPNTTYFVKLVVSNGTSSAIINTNTIYTGSIPSTNFVISELHTTGGITLGPNNSVIYTKSPNKTTADLWRYDTTNFTLTAANLVGGMTSAVSLYNNNGTLAASSGSTLTAENSQWTYDTDGQARWCLRSSPNTCMHLATPITDSEVITVSTGSTTQWKNTPINVSAINGSPANMSSNMFPLTTSPFA